MNPTPPTTSRSPWQRFSERFLQIFHAYAGWLVSITWKRFILLSLALIVSMAILHDIPPFSWTYTEIISDEDIQEPPTPPRKPKKSKSEKSSRSDSEGVNISIDENGVRIQKMPSTKAAAASAAQQPGSAPTAPTPPAAPTAPGSIPETPADASGAVNIQLKLPPDVDAEEARRALEEARRDIQEAIETARTEAREAAQEAANAIRPRIRTHKFGEPLMPLTIWFILISAIIKFTYKGTVQAQAKAVQAQAQAAQAAEVAESESLKRQVVEARMAAMQAQVEPHFLFNTLASIDHLIETDPPRASIMQKNLIALLRASMPTMREANAQGTRDLGRELAVIRPYLEILKVRMEERLHTEVQVSDGLLSAEFPPMMLQSLVENAIKHGLEPKAEGGSLTVSAEIVHGKLAVTVADTGLGFGKAATAGTGIGLSNIRERLALLYGNKASLSITETAGGGTTVTITVPYVAREQAGAAE